jgi:hypothetical protein
VPDLSFTIDRAEPEPHAAAPLLVFKLRITEAGADAAGATSISAVALRCQIRIEPARRAYEPPEQGRLLDLFGEPGRWGRTLRGLLWTQASLVVPPFSGATVVDLPVPCSYDFHLAATRYFDALEGGDIPLVLLFSGTIFYFGEAGHLQVGQIPWEKEAGFRLPVHVWRDLMARHYPDGVWLCLHKDLFDRLSRYKSRRGLPTWERALEDLLDAGDAQEGP